MKLHDKIISTVIGSWILGERTDVKLLLTKSQLDVLNNTLLKTRAFTESIERGKENVVMSEIVNCLREKNEAMKSFKKTFGIDWPA